MKKFILDLWFRKIELKIRKLPQEEKIDYLCRLLFKEVDSVYDLGSSSTCIKSFELQTFEDLSPGVLYVGGLCKSYSRKIKLEGDK